MFPRRDVLIMWGCWSEARALRSCVLMNSSLGEEAMWRYYCVALGMEYIFHLLRSSRARVQTVQSRAFCV
jgi:hypothetical protein